MSGIGFPAFDPVTVADAEAPAVTVEVRSHYFVPRLVVLTVAGTEGCTAALDEKGALALMYALSGWVVARRQEMRGATS